MSKIKYISFTVLLVGLVVFCYSLSLKPYTNAEEYSEKYNQLSDTWDTEAFYVLRESYLTPKYTLEDYSITAIILAVSLWVLFLQTKNLRTPKRKATIITIGIIAVISTIIAFVGDLFLDSSRGSFPYWADTIIIPLMEIPSILTILFIWYTLQLTGLIGSFKTKVTFHIPKLNIPVVLYGIQLLAVLGFNILLAIEGAFWYLISGIIWCSFFFCLMLGRSSIEINKKLKKTKTPFF